MKGFITSPRDRANLVFLLTATPDAYKRWASTCTEDDFLYAEQLLAAYARELKLNDFESMVEFEIEMMDGQYKDCQEVLKKFHVN
jgi:hypothetical protein